jgi:hypothetical protein
LQIFPVKESVNELPGSIMQVIGAARLERNTMEELILRSATEGFAHFRGWYKRVVLAIRHDLLEKLGGEFGKVLWLCAWCAIFTLSNSDGNDLLRSCHWMGEMVRL